MQLSINFRTIIEFSLKTLLQIIIIELSNKHFDKRDNLISHHEQFLLLPQCFPISSAAEASESVCILGKV